MDNEKKQVILRNQYRRKRRAFFHNEEREERIKQEREAEKQQIAKEQQQSKVNEERVKDNMRKARIEKLTQEEIHQQHELANERQKDSNNERNREDQHNDTSTHLNTSENEDISKSENEKDKQKSFVNIDHQKQHHNENKKVDNNQIKKKAPHSITNNDTENNSHKDQDTITNKQNGSQDVFNNNEANNKHHKHESNKQLRPTENKSESKLSKNKSHKNSKQDIEKKEHVISNDSINNKKNNDKNQHITNDSTKVDQKDNSDNLGHLKNGIISFFKEHWPKIVIIVGIILLLLILNAIFTTVNKNDHTNDSAFNGNNQNYTPTMKNANNTVKSVVTVQNDASNNTTVPKSKSGSDNEIGSGVVYKKVGDAIYILTNAHVVGDKSKQKITYNNNKSVEGKVIGKDKWSDVAVVRAKIADDNIKTITMGDSDNLILGQSILVVGNPLGVDFKGSVSKGIISGLNRHVPVDIDKDDSYDVLMKAFQVDAPVNPGNSGGAVVDKDGRLIGIVSLKIDMQNVEGMAFAIPINDVRKIARELEDKGKVTYPNTGIKIKNVADLTSDERDSIQLPSKVDNGVVVEDVKGNSLGEKSGLKKDDVIVELDGKTVEDNLRYRQIVFSHKDDLKTLTAKVYRNGSEKNIKIKLK